MANSEECQEIIDWHELDFTVRDAAPQTVAAAGLCIAGATIAKASYELASRMEAQQFLAMSSTARAVGGVSLAISFGAGMVMSSRLSTILRTGRQA